jgi:hypothetical protein
VPFANSKAIAEGVRRFLSDPVLMTATRKRAWKLGRAMIWSVVAKRHMESFERARASLSVSPRKAFAARTLDNRPYELPPLKLDHLLRMTDNTGIFQHAIFNVPNFAEGYCTDNNARGLSSSACYWRRRRVSRLISNSSIWPAFISRSYGTLLIKKPVAFEIS